jgi:hypothetical protein
MAARSGKCLGEYRGLLSEKPNYVEELKRSTWWSMTSSLTQGAADRRIQIVEQRVRVSRVGR